MTNSTVISQYPKAFPLTCRTLLSLRSRPDSMSLSACWTHLYRRCFQTVHVEPLFQRVICCDFVGKTANLVQFNVNLRQLSCCTPLLRTLSTMLLRSLTFSQLSRGFRFSLASRAVKIGCVLSWLRCEVRAILLGETFGARFIQQMCPLNTDKSH